MSRMPRRWLAVGVAMGVRAVVVAVMGRDDGDSMPPSWRKGGRRARASSGSAGCRGRGAGVGLRSHGEAPPEPPFAYGAAILAPSFKDAILIPGENLRRRWTSESRSIMCETSTAATRELQGQTPAAGK